jgi:thiamine transporter
MNQSRTRVLVEIALTVALCAVLHFFRLWQMPAGGSVSLEMLPLLVLGLRRGAGAGFVAGILFGFVDFMIEPFFVHWAQLFLDYPIAFGAVGGLAGLWRPLWLRRTAAGGSASGYAAISWIGPLSVLTAALGRYIAHFVSGVVFFATAKYYGPLPDGTSAFSNAGALSAASTYSALYNLYVPISAVACLVALILILPVLERGLPTGDVA